MADLTSLPVVPSRFRSASRLHRIQVRKQKAIAPQEWNEAMCCCNASLAWLWSHTVHGEVTDTIFKTDKGERSFEGSLEVPVLSWQSAVRLTKMQPSVVATLVCALLCGLGTNMAVAFPIATVNDADDLCETTEPILTNDGADADLNSDPVLQTQRRHEYGETRNRRLLDVYSVTIDTSTYRFLPSEPSVLTVDTLEPFQLFGGVYWLELTGVANISFAVSDADREAIIAGFASDQILLSVHFNLASLDNPDEPFCRVGADDATIIIGQLLAAELLSRTSYESLARVETDRYRDQQIRLGSEPTDDGASLLPSVLISATVFLSATPSEEEIALLEMEAETQLLPCYVRGLNVNGRLQGAIVLTYSVESDGSVSEPLISIDAIDEPHVTGCVMGNLEGMSIPRTQSGSSYQVRMTVIFRIE